MQRWEPSSANPSLNEKLRLMSAGLRRGAMLIAFGLSLAACGGPSFDGQVFKNEQLSFRVTETPKGWRQIDASHALVSFRDDAAQATIAISGRCGQDGDDVPLSALTHHLFLHFTDRQISSQETLMLDEREAMRTELVAKLDGVPKHFIIYVLKKNNCVYDFLHISPAESNAAESSANFERFVHSFQSLEP